MGADSEAVLIGLVVAVAVVGLVGGVGLTVLLCVKWKQYVKLRNESRIHPSNRTNRRRRIRVRNVNEDRDITGQPAVFEPPPAYSEIDSNPLPPYTPMGILNPHRLNISRGNNVPNTPQNASRPSTYTRRNSHFTGTTNTPMVTPSVSMFTTSVAGTREPSASSNVRSTAMVHIE